jgi:hypothetical protein
MVCDSPATVYRKFARIFFPEAAGKFPVNTASFGGHNPPQNPSSAYKR